MTNPPFTVVKGDWVATSSWLDFPPTLRARDPHNRDRLCDLRVSRNDVLRAADSRRRQPAYEFWSVLNGQAPPVPTQNADVTGLSMLLDAHACFVGLRRPCADDDHGSGRVAYILKPKAFFVYENRPPVVLTTRETVPPDLVFVAYARLDEPPSAEGVKGVLTHWEFVEADERDPMLPADFDKRYNLRLW